MEQYLGRELRPDEIVHHINGNKLDNRLENLQIMTNSEHTKLHLTQNDLPTFTRKAVAQYSLDGKYIATYISSRDAAKIALKDESKNAHISDVCTGKRKIAYGYRWKYIN